MSGVVTAPEWQPPPRDLALDAGDVQLWRARLDCAPEAIAAFAATLSADESARAARFRFDRDRNRFVVGRGVLRAILGRYLAVPPAALRFSYGTQGKPALLAADDASAALRFNVSHSRALAVYAITRKREIGIDLEYMRDDIDFEGLAGRFFAPSEAAQLQALPPALRRDAFFRCWSRKEAFIKARGEGLTIPLDAFEVSLIPGAPPTLLSMRAEESEAQRWVLRDVAVADAYAAALAVEGAGWSQTQFDFPAAGTAC